MTNREKVFREAYESARQTMNIASATMLALETAFPDGDVKLVSEQYRVATVTLDGKTYEGRGSSAIGAAEDLFDAMVTK